MVLPFERVLLIFAHVPCSSVPFCLSMCFQSHLLEAQIQEKQAQFAAEVCVLLLWYVSHTCTLVIAVFEVAQGWPSGGHRMLCGRAMFGGMRGERHELVL